jgi:hypothetical protein
MKKVLNWLQFKDWVEWNRKTNIFLGVLLGVILIIWIIISAIRGSSEEVLTLTGQEDIKPKQNTNEEIVNSPVMPCMEDDPNLVFHHAVQDVILQKGESYTWDRPHGYEVKWCAYEGQVKQLTKERDLEMILEGITNAPAHVMVRYYVKKH